MAADKTIELGTQLTPKFDANGLIPAIAQDAKTSQRKSNSVILGTYASPNHQSTH
ncbi:MAG: hypothetical protein ABSF37_03015 [Sedimentisphaerales bacterium]